MRPEALEAAASGLASSIANIRLLDMLFAVLEGWAPVCNPTLRAVLWHRAVVALHS